MYGTKTDNEARRDKMNKSCALSHQSWAAPVEKGSLRMEERGGGMLPTASTSAAELP